MKKSRIEVTYIMDIEYPDDLPINLATYSIKETLTPCNKHVKLSDVRFSNWKERSENEELTCPCCGSADIQIVTLEDNKKTYVCSDCDFESHKKKYFFNIF